VRRTLDQQVQRVEASDCLGGKAARHSQCTGNRYPADPRLVLHCSQDSQLTRHPGRWTHHGPLALSWLILGTRV